MSWPAANPTGAPPTPSRTRCRACTRLRSAPGRRLTSRCSRPREECSERCKVAGAVPLGVRRLGDDDDNASDRNERSDDLEVELARQAGCDRQHNDGCNAPIVVAFTMVVVFTAVGTEQHHAERDAACCGMFENPQRGLLPRSRSTRKITNGTPESIERNCDRIEVEPFDDDP